jgi:proteasome lid subunit RPN8/RPN11
MFHVGAVRSYEDPELKEEARQKALEPAKRKVAREYAEYLAEKHSTVDERLLKKVNFDSKKTGFLSLGKEEPVDLKELEKDERVVATVHTDPPFIVTIADLASAVQEVFYHGIETSADRKKKLDDEKQVVLKNLLFKKTAVAEARILGFDQTDAYLDTMDEFVTSLLFDVFVKKVIAPDVEISEDEVREYFEANIEEYSTPTMFRMNAIVFNELEDAESALRKLRRRADFKWVSANSPGRVDEGNQEILDFDGALLTVTSLPEDLHERIEDTEQGDSLIYSDDKGYHHVLVIKEVFPSKPQPYESIRAPVANAIFQQKLKLLIEDWAEKLKEAYETRIFVKGLGD